MGYNSLLLNMMQSKAKSNATIVHGVAPHALGWSSDFTKRLRTRAPEQDYFEHTWSGFSLTGLVVPVGYKYSLVAKPLLFGNLSEKYSSEY